MRCLLDTHTFIWLDDDPDLLSTRVITLCQDSANQLMLNVASVWEMQIKLQTGRLELPLSLQEMVERQREVNDIEIIPVTLSHIWSLAELPMHHRDPFDRMLIAQARVLNATLITNDPQISLYPVTTYW